MTAYVILSLGLSPVFTMATDLIVGTAPPERRYGSSALGNKCPNSVVRWALRSLGASSRPYIAA